ncbi:MAG: carbohydrate-binding protein, partial [Fibrobacteraceae bacterium]|nr:carbohydrate-binding protein [Fibrobacteraceae bacterium]
GIIVGYNSEGDWLEYTVDVKEAGEYTMFAAVAAAGNTSSFMLSIDGMNIADRIAVPANSGEENYDDYNKVSVNVELPAGKHILRFTVVGAWMDIDYITFVKGADATDPEPITGGDPVVDPGTAALQPQLSLTDRSLEDYDVFDMQGVYMGRLSAYGITEAVSMMKHSSVIQSKGVYNIRSRATGKMQSVRIAK